MIDPTFVFTITLYNKYQDKGKKTCWKRTVLRNCYFGTVMGERLNNDTLNTNDTFVCRIPQNSAYSDVFNGENNKFTLKPGDIIVKGTVNDIIADVSGQRPADILNKYRSMAFSVKNVSVNTLLPFAKHYRASGV